MDPIVAGLIGGAFSAAIVTAFVNVYLEAWRNRRADRQRFLDVKRERYAALALLLREMWAATPEEPWPQADKAHALATEIELLSPEVGRAALRATYSLTASDGRMERNEYLAQTWVARLEFLEAAWRDLGIAPPKRSEPGADVPPPARE